jgi:hypothetical protein
MGAARGTSTTGFCPQQLLLVAAGSESVRADESSAMKHEAADTHLQQQDTDRQRERALSTGGQTARQSSVVRAADDSTTLTSRPMS